MSDIVERLREAASGGNVFVSPGQAADEIEKLQATLNFAVTSHHEAVNTVISLVAERDTLRAALHDLAKHVWRGDMEKLRPETQAVLGEKADV